MIGQYKLVEFINNVTLDSCPRSIILNGEFGSGKHTLCEALKNHLGIELRDISDEINVELLEEISQRPEPYLYLINTNNFKINDQNAILKFIEEPLKNAYIVILTECKNKLLPTILNRCQVFDLEPYSTRDLLSYSNEIQDEDILSRIVRTPGRLKILKSYDISNLYLFAEKIVTKMHLASFNNAFKILDKIAFDNEKDKYEPKILVDFILYYINRIIKQDNNTKYLDAYKLTSKLASDMLILNIDNRYLFKNYISNMWLLMRS